MANKHTPAFKAHCTDNGLVLSFFSKSAPELLHIDLAGADTAHFFIKQGEDSHSIVLRRKGSAEDYEVYAFDDEKQALKAFRQITQAMLSSGSRAACPHKRSWFMTLVKWLLIAGIVLVLAALLLFPRSLNGVDPALLGQMQAPSSVPSQQASPVETGKPVPLEEMLQ